MGRQSIAPTYDHRETGDRFSVETRVNDRRVSVVSCRDPFVFHRVTVGWRDLLRGLLRRRLEVVVLVGGDRDIVEDVMELDDDYAGAHGSSRRAEFKASLNRALAEFGRDDG